jgi:hypothetical protein
MSLLVKSEFVTLQSALESTLGVQATSGYRQHQINPGGAQNFYPQINKVARSPLSKNLQDEKGDIVGLSSMPSIVHDANKDLIDYFAEGIFRSATKFSGGTGVGRWQVANGAGGVSLPTVALTAVTATDYTVASGGALPANVLIFARGFANAANNGLKVVGAASTSTAIKTSGLVAEASPPAGAMVEVVGYQAASADFAINASQNLTSAANVFTTLGLNVGQWIWIGGGTAAAPGSLGFATAADRGFARITAIAAGTLSLDRRSQTYSADTGTGKTIQIFFGPWLRNVAGDHADYKEPSYTLELSEPGAAAAGATDYVYGLGSCINTYEFSSPLEDKTMATVAFVGTDMSDPTTTRATNANLAMPNVNTAALNSVSEEKRLRISNTDETGVSTDIVDWKMTINNNVKAQKQQGTLGAARMIFGKFQVSLDVTCVFVQDDVCKAIRDNRTCMFDAAFRNGDGAVLYDVPAVTLDSGAPSFAANEAVTLATNLKAFRDPTYGYTCGMSLFPSLPAS